jgi:hypothetical protein
MLALPEMLKKLVPFRNFFLKDSLSRKHIFERLTDLITIIISIYLALSIEGWAEKRTEHRRLEKYYHNLTSEIAKDTVSLTEVSVDAAKHIETAKTHIGLLRRYNSSDQDSVTGLFRSMLSSQVFYSSEMVSYQAMLLSGDIRLIENLEVRQKLIELEEVYKGLRIYEDLFLSFITNDLMKAFAESFDLIDMRLIDPENYSHTEYRNLVVKFLSLNTTRQQQYHEALKKARETLVVIQRELGTNQ